MKIVVLAESPADRAAIEIFAQAILDDEIEFATVQPRTGGYHAVAAAIRPNLLHLHYQRSADGLIVVVDSDGTPIEAGNTRGRVHLLLSEIQDIQSQLSSSEKAPAIKTAVGVAAPSIESWLLFGINKQCTEAGWVVRLNDGQNTAVEIRQLKKQLYGTDRPDINLETQVMIERAKAIIDENRLETFMQSFPYGFKQLVSDLRAW